MEIYKEFSIDAAHFLPGVPQGHKCGKLHGHTFKVKIFVSGKKCEKSGWIIDFGDLKQVFQMIHDELDHSFLNEIKGLENPTSENIACWIWARLKPFLPGLSKIIVKETDTSGCVYEGELS